MRSGSGRLVLGIETSCDETAAAVVEDGRRIRSNVIASQIAVHRPFGGVVPEIASRRHLVAMLPVIRRALEEAGTEPRELSAVAVTYGPGLVGSLLVGLSAAKALALALGVPLIGVNHLEGHLFANLLVHPELGPPYLCLIVSGGHTELVEVRQPGEYRVLGRTRDDAAGEAFDKIGRAMGLSYPAGPQIDRLAAEARAGHGSSGDPAVPIALPRAMLDEGSLDFSFSGLKTAAVQLLEAWRREGRELPVAALAAAVQEAIVEVLAVKTLRAVRAAGIRRVALSGGVAANRGLRRAVVALQEQEPGLQVFFPPLELCTDNGAMIAAAGDFHLLRGERSRLDLAAAPWLELGERDLQGKGS